MPNICPNCGRENSPAAQFCTGCGKSLPPAPTALQPAIHVEQQVESALGTVIGVVQGNIGAIYMAQPQTLGERSPRQQIQPPSPDYVPRPAVEDRLRALLTETYPGIKLAVLYGLPGLGKTTLAQKTAYDLGGAFPDARLWVDVAGKPEIDLFSALIDPFEPPPERKPYADLSQYRDALQRAIGQQRVLMVLNRVDLKDQERLAAILPRAAPNAAALLIADANLPELADEAHSICLGEMTPEEAEGLFRNVWKGAFLTATSQVLQELAAELGYVPGQIALVARDMLQRQVKPADYLDEMRRLKSARPYAFTSNISGFQTVFENLPPEGRTVLPYLGVMGGSAWSAEGLTMVSQLPHEMVNSGLAQMTQVGFVQPAPNGRYRSSPAARQFALDTLRSTGGEPLVRLARALMAHHIHRRAVDMAFLTRQSLLREYLEDLARRKRYFQRMRETFVDDTSQEHGNTSILLVTPGMGDIDLPQLVFENTVLSESPFGERWLEWLNSPVCLDMARNLEEALGWMVEQETWSLVRRFAMSSVGAFVSALEKEGKDSAWITASAIGLRFGALHHLRLTYVDFESILSGVRLVTPLLNNVHLIGARWIGIHLHRPNFLSVDAVNAQMPGLVVRGGQWVDVDGRGCDLRGAVFYNCRFTRLNLREADLREVDFIGCTGQSIDLRGARLDEIGFHNCTFDNVMYYKSDEGRFISS